MSEIILPWPPIVLSPNKKAHWRKKAPAAKAYRGTCFITCKLAALKIPTFSDKLHLWVDFHPPRAGKRDADNALSSIKSGIDGIADYLGVDDSNYVFHPWVKEKIAGGCVKIRFTGGPHD